MNKLCVFNSKKLCSDCNQCNSCDLDSSRICDNCGKCLELEGADMKAINIDEIKENGEEEYGNYYLNGNFGEELTNDDIDINYIDDVEEELYENSETWELIDDIDGLTEVLEDEKKSKAFMKELYPGLIYIEKRK
jgi:hypothetical protein